MPFALLTTLVLSVAGTASADTYTVTLDPAARDTPTSGRVVLFFVTETGRDWDRRRPIDGPFYESPQPIASVAVDGFNPGESIVIDGSVFAFPHSLDKLDGVVRVQAILDQDKTVRCHTEGPGNVYSDIVTVELASEREDHVELTLRHVIETRPLPEMPNLKWIELHSELLSEFYGREMHHRAGVALPKAYLEPDADRKEWPAIYVVPGFGGRHEGAAVHARMFQAPGIEEIAPMAVTIVLDPDSALGHHGFTDSPNHGPRGTALVTELIPHLEAQFRLVAKPEARIVTGHSSGGWTSLWLQLNWPDVFGACWSSAPDPIDFRAFQKTNIYEDESVYVMPGGRETPSYRMRGHDEEFVVMTVRQECLMEYAIHPLGGSGQQWDAWAAMFSPRDPSTSYPARMFDPLTGRIDRNVVEHWKQFDIARMVRDDWERFGPIVTDRVRLVCGEFDCYYLQRAVRLFRSGIEEHAGNDSAQRPGYVFIHPDADHGSIVNFTFMRWNREMREYLRERGLHD
jgi:hypothetical protein